MLLIADNLQVFCGKTGKALEDLDPQPIQRVVLECLKAGVEAIDINPGPLTREPERKMTFLVEIVQEMTHKTILLDTSNPTALEAGLKVAKNRVIINGFSLEKKKLDYVLPLARKYDVDIIGYLLQPDGHVPRTYEDRLNVAVDLYTAFRESGLPDEKLIVDPIVVPLLWEDGLDQNRAVLEVIRTLPEVLGYPVRTIVGLSNLTSGKGPRKQKRFLEMAYLPMLTRSGLSMVMLNVLHTETVEVARSCDILLNSQIFAWENPF